MIKGIVITLFVLIGIFDILLILGCAKLEREQEEYEAYERWKERKEQTMKYENMPKGRNKDICVRCGKRVNFADRLKPDVQYDLLCLAETTSYGYITHGNVKLCGKCMSELLMWLDADDYCSYGGRKESE